MNLLPTGLIKREGIRDLCLHDCGYISNRENLPFQGRPDAYGSGRVAESSLNWGNLTSWKIIGRNKVGKARGTTCGSELWVRADSPQFRPIEIFSLNDSLLDLWDTMQGVSGITMYVGTEKNTNPKILLITSSIGKLFVAAIQNWTFQSGAVVAKRDVHDFEILLGLNRRWGTALRIFRRRVNLLFLSY